MYRSGGYSDYASTMKSVPPRGNQDDIRDGYASKYSHDNEIARPEYYSLILDRYNIKAELTAMTGRFSSLYLSRRKTGLYTD